MAFCINCGAELPDGAKFCHECGQAVGSEENTGNTQRQQVFEGKIHKCPNCGEVIAAFARNCPTCGHEFRDVEASSAVKIFAAKLAEIEASKIERGFI